MRIIGFGALAAMAGLVLGGCSNDPGFAGVTGVREANANEVAACRYITDINMRPGVYGILAEEGVKYARNTIMADAKDAGANTVVFDQVAPGADIYKLHAQAFSC